MNIVVTPELLELFRRHRLATKTYRGERWSVGDRVFVNPEARIEPYAHIFRGVVVPKALGAFSYSHSGLDQAISIGRYCSLAANVELMGAAHPWEWASSSPFSYDPHPIPGFLAYMRDVQAEPIMLHPIPHEEKRVDVAHDVWIGAGALFSRGVTIGTGAVVGARSVVTRDVPPYAIVAGAPARIVRYRFPEALIDRLLRSGWWRFAPDMLHRLDVREPERFLDRFEEAVAGGATPLDLTPLTGAQIIAAGGPVP